jgi:hypothetical protein
LDGYTKSKKECLPKGKEFMNLSSRAVNQDAISTPSFENLMAYLHYQYPATQGDIKLNNLCESICSKERRLSKLTKAGEMDLKRFAKWFLRQATDLHGCTTGDCPHEKSDQCAEACLNQFKQAVKEDEG